MECPIDILAEHDGKGLYKRALMGEIQNFSGVTDPYEPPLNPDVTIHAYRETIEEGVGKIWKKLNDLRFVSCPF
jgi:adenylylsulfate kinase